jgi:hypothetical protein
MEGNKTPALTSNKRHLVGADAGHRRQTFRILHYSVGVWGWGESHQRRSIATHLLPSSKTGKATGEAEIKYGIPNILSRKDIERVGANLIRVVGAILAVVTDNQVAG